jgi:glycosyltransferase involved in cell wall biosynthesis
MNEINSKLNRITVVTPSYNMANFLSQTIESVLFNLEEGDEYYIIDGGSTDGTVDIIKQYGNRITGWLSENDNGYAHALKKGFDKSNGDILCWINVGDLLLPNALNIVRSEFKRSDVDLVFGDDYYIDENSLIIKHSRGQVYDLHNMMLYSGWTPLQDACFWKKSLYDLIGGINENLKNAADYDLFLRMNSVGGSRYLPAVLSAFRQHKDQKSILNINDYKVERSHCRNIEIRKSDNSFLYDVIMNIIHWLLIRFRARLKFLNQRNSRFVGNNISTVSAEYIN